MREAAFDQAVDGSRAAGCTARHAALAAAPHVAGWSAYNMTEYRRFRDREESLRYFGWRSEQYFDYQEHMPVMGQDGKVMLDYGCGPGHDLVGFGEFSKRARLIGMDVSTALLREAEERLALHGARPEMVRISESTAHLPLPDASVDYVHCRGCSITSPIRCVC